MTDRERKIFDLVRSSLNPEMVPLRYRRASECKFVGHCHHATIAMYELLGGKSAGYKVRKAIDEMNIVHYWLETREGEKIDPTAEQYTELGRRLPYDKKVTTGVSYRRSNHASSIICAVRELLGE